MPTDAMPPLCRRLLLLAERDPRRAVPGARRALVAATAGDQATRAWAEYTLGWALLCWERFDEAWQYLEAASAAFDALGMPHAAAVCHHAILLVELWLVDRPGLDTDFAALAERYTALGDAAGAARAWMDYARQLNVAGDAVQAEAVLDGVVSALPPPPSADHARWLRTKSICANLRGDLRRASSLLDASEQMFAGLGYRLDVARCWLEQGWLALRQERLDHALGHYRRAERAYQRLDLPLRLAFCAKNIGLLLTRRGEYDGALRETLTALSRFTALNRTSDIAGCQLNLGNIFYYTARWEAALACYKRAEELFDARGIVGERLVAQRNQAIVYRVQGRLPESQSLLLAAEQEVRRLGQRSELAAIWDEQAAILAESGAIEPALALYRQAQQLFAEVGSEPSAADTVLEQAWLVLGQGQVEQSQALLEAAAPSLRLHPHKRWRLHYGLARCAELQGDTAEALAQYRAASGVIALLRRRLADEHMSSGLYLQAAQLHSDALQLTASLRDGSSLLELSEGQRALVLQRLLTTQRLRLPAEYQAEHDALRQRLSALLDGAEQTQPEVLDAALGSYSEFLLRARHTLRETADLSDIRQVAPLDLPLLRSRLAETYGPDWTVLTYIQSGATLLICVMTPEELLLEQTPYDARLQNMIMRASQPAYRLFTYGDVAAHGPGREPWAQLRALAARLLPEAALRRLGPDHRLIVVPAGPLHALPWGALRLADCWLTERAVVQIAPSLQTLQTLLPRSRPPTDAALLLACSTFGERAAALPGVGMEIDAVRERWPSLSAQLIDAEATRDALLGALAEGDRAGYGVIHIASHAQLLPSRGLGAHVKLWDGDLLLPEIVNLRLGGGLVVLSACDGAAADALPGEEILSLSWAFVAAGASAVLACVWPLEDRVARIVVAAFYEALWRTGDAALALALAQRQLIGMHAESPAPETGPQSWSGFVLTGHWALRSAAGDTPL